jgi:hypothetical protein
MLTDVSEVCTPSIIRAMRIARMMEVVHTSETSVSILHGSTSKKTLNFNRFNHLKTNLI